MNGHGKISPIRNRPCPGPGAAPRALVVGSGAGGAAVARELQGAFHVTVLEAGKSFRPLSLSMGSMEHIRNSGLLLDPRLATRIFPAMRVQKTTGGMFMVSGRATGGTTTLATGNALRMDETLRSLGIRLDEEFAELARELPISTEHQGWWSESTRRLFDISGALGLDPRPTPKMVDCGRCRRCGRCVLGCPFGAKWDSRRFLDQALENGAELIEGCAVDSVAVKQGRAVGVQARVGPRTVFMPADLVVLSAGGLGTPAILERSGIACEPRLFVDPVLCVAAPWPGASQQHEIPMPFVLQRPGYIISPYFDHLSFLFDRRWRHPAGSILGLMIKLADTERGRVPQRRGRIEKALSDRDVARLAEAERLCRDILARFGAKSESMFLGTLNAGHPGGMLPLGASDAETLHSSRLPPNLYVADATLFPQSLGNPPIMTILALAMRVARVALRAGASRHDQR